MKRFLSIILTILLMISVFPVMASASETYTSVSFDRELASFTVTGSGFNSTDSKCTFIVTGYDENGALVDFLTKDVPLTANSATEFNVTIDLTESDKYSDIKSAKTMLWDSLDNVRPIVAEEKFEAGVGFEYASVTGNALSCKSSATATATTYEKDANNALVDGDLTTNYGTGPVNGAYYTFIDLGAGGGQVDKVVINTTDVRTVGQVYYLADTVPVKGADSTNWVKIGTRTAVGTMTMDLTEEQSGTYRYIVADCTSATVGGYINEIEAYEKVTYKLVSSNADAYRLNCSSAEQPTYPVGKILTDGVLYDTTQSGGFGQAIAQMTWIDLGEEKQIDKVKIYVRDSRSIGQKYYLSNTPPAYTWAEDDGVLLGTLSALPDTVTALEYDLAAEQAGKYRYVIMKTDSNAGGYLTEMEAYEKLYDVVSSDAPAYRLNCNSVGNGVINHDTVLTDGVVTTATAGQAGFGNKIPSMTWIDLGEAKQIDKVEIYSVGNRSKGQKYFLSNVQPQCSTTYTWQESDGVLLGTQEQALNGVMEFECVLSAEQAGKYRYVIMLTDANSGGHLTEIKAYAEK